MKLDTPLTIDEVEFRVQSISHKGWATILVYKDARVDMSRLDKVVGPHNWQKKYDVISGNLFCSVGIKDKESGEWIWKQDVGTESNTEKEKGQASDAFKRACFNWGIGRELYEYPRILLPLKSNEFKVIGDKVKQTWDLRLRDWEWNSEFEGNKIVSLSAEENGVTRFSWTLKGGSKRINLNSGTNSPFPKTTIKRDLGETLFNKLLLRINKGEMGLLDKAKLEYNIKPHQLTILDSAEKEYLIQKVE